MCIRDSYGILPIGGALQRLMRPLQLDAGFSEGIELECEQKMPGHVMPQVALQGSRFTVDPTHGRENSKKAETRMPTPAPYTAAQPRAQARAA